MKHINELLESIFDTEDHVKNFDGEVFYEEAEKLLQKHMSISKKKPIDMFGREIKVGDVCFAYVTMEFHMIQVKDIIDDGGWPMIVPSKDYKYLDGRGTVDPVNCLVIPKKHYGDFLKVIKK